MALFTLTSEAGQKCILLKFKPYRNRSPIFTLVFLLISFVNAAVKSSSNSVGSNLFWHVSEKETFLLSHYLHDLHSDGHPHLCCYYSSISAVVPSDLLQVYVDPGNFQGLFKWTLYLTLRGRLFSCWSRGCWKVLSLTHFSKSDQMNKNQNLFLRNFQHFAHVHVCT